MHSSPMLMETISNVEHMLNTSYYIAKKNRSKPEIFFNSQVFSVIYQCITAEIDYSNKYILNFLPELPFGYVLCSKIELNNDGNYFLYFFNIRLFKILKNVCLFFSCLFI